MHFGISRKRVFTAILLLAMAGHYVFFNVHSALNGDGRDVPEWPLLADLFISFPLLYYLMFRPTLREFLTKWLGLIALGIAFGSVTIPNASKQVWRGIEAHWLPLALAEAALEIYLMVVLIHKITALIRLSGDADEALAKAIRERFGTAGFAPFALFEARIWFYGLFLRRGENLHFSGDQHFHYDKNDGNASNQFAFIMLLIFDMPLTHLIVHLIATRPIWAWLTDIASLWALLYLVAEYRASHWRPISLDRDKLLLRCGVFCTDRVVPLEMVESVNRCKDGVKRARGVLRLRQFGRINVTLRLRAGSKLPDSFGRMRPVSAIYLSLDEANQFIEALRIRLT